MPELPDRSALPGWRTVLRRTVHLVGIIILLAVVVAAALYAVPQLAGAENSYVVLSGSMEPAIGPGDIVLVDEVDISAIEPGDVVTYNRGEGLPTTHRVIDVGRTNGQPALVTKGDANEDPDAGMVHRSQLVGRVLTIGGHLVVIPLFGHVVHFASTSSGTVLLLLIPLALLILNETYERLGSGDDSSRTGTTGSDTLAAGSSGPAAGPDGDAVSLGRPDLTLTLLVLAVVAPYSGWMLLRTRDPPSAMVFAGAVVGLLLITYGRARLWLANRRSDRPTADGGRPRPQDDRPDESTAHEGTPHDE